MSLKSLVHNLLKRKKYTTSLQSKSLAFTLAEVLITLAIIGVVAALTIPSLVQKYREKQTIAVLSETQAILTQAIELAEEEYGDIPGWDNISKIKTHEDAAKSATILAERIKPYLKISADCGMYDEYAKCFPLTPYKYLNNSLLSISYAAEPYKYKLSLLNGVSITLQMIQNTYNMQINVDINGVSKPNYYGKDLFLFQYNSDSKSLLPMGAPNTLYPLSTCSLDNTGAGCAYYVLKNKNMNYLHQ